MKYKYILCFIAAVAVISACKKPYNPTIISSPNHYLVVEGAINSGGDTTTIKLSLTVNVSESVNSSPVAADVKVQDESGNKIGEFSSPQNNGVYKSNGGLNIDPAKKYRVFISYNGQDYASDYTAVKVNPPIDSVGFFPKNGALNIYVNTHDATNNTRYYRWDYSEAWKFHAKYESGFIVENGGLRNRRANEAIYYCYTNDASSNIILGSSAKLASDVIFQAPITIIPSTAEKLSVRYSILLKQYAISKDEYNFWENIRKNTEQLGSIFDAQPSQLQGNVHCITKPTEPVIGFIGVTNVQQKRIYINNFQLPSEWYPLYPYDCSADTALLFNPKNMQHEVQSLIIDGGSIAVTSIVKGISVIGYTFSTVECTDCTLRGKLTPPPFWKP
jgi:hypothetical protein